MIGFGLVLLVLGEVEVVLSPRGLGTTALYDAEVCVCVCVQSRTGGKEGWRVSRKEERD